MEITPKHLDVLKLVWDDTPNRLIAKKLGISEAIVGQRKNKLVTQFGCQSMLGVCRKALQAGILTVPVEEKV